MMKKVSKIPTCSPSSKSLNNLDFNNLSKHSLNNLRLAASLTNNSANFSLPTNASHNLSLDSLDLTQSLLANLSNQNIDMNAIRKVEKVKDEKEKLIEQGLPSMLLGR